MPPTRVVPDSSFYICFLDDIQRVDALLRLVTCDAYSLVMGVVIRREVTAKRCPEDFLDAVNTHVEAFEYSTYGEILRPFFSVEEVDKGETEAVVISFILHQRGEVHVLIIDESPARRFVGRRFPDLERYMTGTVGFLETSTVLRNISTPEETIDLLREMLVSTFRVDPGIVHEAIERLEAT
jgi:predicted nucleic acid-binding protein